MRIKTIPIGQMLVLALLIFLVGIVITAVMKKTNMSSKIRRIVFWGVSNCWSGCCPGRKNKWTIYSSGAIYLELISMESCDNY